MFQSWFCSCKKTKKKKHGYGDEKGTSFISLYFLCRLTYWRSLFKMFSGAWQTVDTRLRWSRSKRNSRRKKEHFCHFVSCRRAGRFVGWLMRINCPLLPPQFTSLDTGRLSVVDAASLPRQMTAQWACVRQRLNWNGQGKMDSHFWREEPGGCGGKRKARRTT